jgi:hypothetical protein
MPLEPMPKELDQLNPVYRHANGELWEVVGYINDPAVVLRNVKTGLVHTEVIGCLNADAYTRLKPV